MPDIHELELSVRKEIFGQDEAIHRIVERLKITRQNMDAHPNRPDGVFLFLGPSGVGKTETARVLATLLYGDHRAFIKLDMSEFMEPHSISKLIGSPPGYVGYDEGSLMTRVMSSGSDKVILLDEIEKAHPQVFSLFLQVFDEGVMTDSHGNKMTFDNTIIIMTSNIARSIWEDQISTAPGFITPEVKRDQHMVNQALLRLLPSEFLNRVDEVIAFNPLTDENLHQIVRYHLDKVSKQVSSRFSIQVVYDEAYVHWLAAEDYEPAFGARHVIRNVEKHVVGKILDDIAAGEIHTGEKVELKPDIEEMKPS